MPIIIDEVVISVEVGGRETTASGSGLHLEAPKETQTLVEECVARVMEILRDQKEP